MHYQKMLLSEGKINRDMIALMDKWRHSGFNVSRGRRKKAGMDDQVPCLLMTELGPAECRKNWAMLKLTKNFNTYPKNRS
jgi:hypothetical protein